MQAGLRRFPVELGNGADDERFFQLDDASPRYAEAKAAILDAGDAVGRRHRFVAADEASPGDLEALEAVRAWMLERLSVEWPGHLPSSADFDALARGLQEDFAILRRPDADAPERAIGVSVCFPSGWRPEAIYGTSFAAIHAPVPDFVDDARAARSMVDSMIERGPYLRFVWTVSADDDLDHHPEHGHRAKWNENARGWLRVERQLTIPFATHGASLFLIRTHLYAFETLDAEQRETLSTALERMPDVIAEYKGLSASRSTILETLARSGPRR